MGDAGHDLRGGQAPLPPAISDNGPQMRSAWSRSMIRADSPKRSAASSRSRSPATSPAPVWPGKNGQHGFAPQANP